MIMFDWNNNSIILYIHPFLIIFGGTCRNRKTCKNTDSVNVQSLSEILVVWNLQQYASSESYDLDAALSARSWV